MHLVMMVGGERARRAIFTFAPRSRGDNTEVLETKVPEVLSASPCFLLTPERLIPLSTPDHFWSLQTLFAPVGTLIAAWRCNSGLAAPPPFKVDLVMSRTLGGRGRSG